MHRYSATFTPLEKQFGQLDVRLHNPSFDKNRQLIIVAVDCSGSMSGNPLNQAKQALEQILHLVELNKLIHLVVVLYSDGTETFQYTTLEETKERIRKIAVMAGTSFPAAFRGIGNYLKTATGYGPDDNLSVVFLTDGQDCSGVQGAELLNLYREQLVWPGQVSCHSVGFGSGINVDLLEKMTQIGTLKGTFRFADPSDGPDTLSFKLAGLIDMVSNHVGVVSQLTFTNFTPIGSTRLTMMLESATAEYSCRLWGELLGSATVTVVNRKDRVTLPIAEAKLNRMLLTQWLPEYLDLMAQKILTWQEMPTGPVKSMTILLYNEQLRTLVRDTPEEELRERAQLLLTSVQALANGQAINRFKLTEAQYSSKFSGTTPRIAAHGEPTKVHTSTAPLLIRAEPEPDHRETPLRRYPRPSTGRLNLMLYHHIYDGPNPDLIKAIQCATVDDFQPDSLNNTPLHWAAYRGTSQMLKLLLARSAELGLTPCGENIYGETPSTIAIKKRGFVNCLNILLPACPINPSRREALAAFAYDQGFLRTQAILASDPGQVIVAKPRMSNEYLLECFNQYQQGLRKIDTLSFLNLALERTLCSIITALIIEHPLSFAQCCRYLLPPRPDHPEVEKYLALLSSLDLTKYSRLCDEQGDTLLHHAVVSGNKPVVELVAKYSDINAQNHLGNTPLWVACAKRYPCIVEALLDLGADPNLANSKGLPPLANICKFGPVKVAMKLLDAGANPEYRSAGDDSLLLICCRHNQHEVLSLLLNYVSEDLVKHRPAFDGFDVVLASVEADSVDCLKVLKQSGIGLKVTTDRENKILPLASPLHLAAYYGRKQCSQFLVNELDLTTVDLNGQTALHIAIIQDQLDIAQILAKTPPIKDHQGLTPQDYVRSPAMRELFCSPLTEALIRLPRGPVSEDVLDCLQTSGPVPGLLSLSTIIQPLLLEAIYYHHLPIITKFAAHVDVSGMGLELALTLSTPKMRRLLKFEPSPEHQRLATGLPRFMMAATASRDDIPLTQRMGRLTRTLVKTFEPSVEDKKMAVQNRSLSAPEVMALHQFSRGLPVLIPWSKLPEFTGEIYMGTTLAECRTWTVGTKITGAWSGSAFWRVAVDAVGEFGPRKQSVDPTILIIKGGGRVLMSYSSTPSEAEVYVPEGEYQVQAWYRGDVIALGQSNIRDYTYKMTEPAKYGPGSGQSLIIVLERV